MRDFSILSTRFPPSISPFLHPARRPFLRFPMSVHLRQSKSSVDRPRPCRRHRAPAKDVAGMCAMKWPNEFQGRSLCFLVVCGGRVRRAKKNVWVVYTSRDYSYTAFPVLVSPSSPPARTRAQYHTAHTPYTTHTLQRTLERLMSSEIPKVGMSWKQQILFGHNTIITAAQWKAALPHMYIWIDYARCGTTYNRT